MKTFEQEKNFNKGNPLLSSFLNPTPLRPFNRGCLDFIKIILKN